MPVIGPTAGYFAGEAASHYLKDNHPEISPAVRKFVKFIVHSTVGAFVGALVAPATMGTDVATSPLSAALHAVLPEDAASGVYDFLAESLDTAADVATAEPRWSP